MSDDQLQECDIVLEGGVTSAVVYAGLLARLSKSYRFKCVGGTSAGAVASAAAAVAELARQVTGSDKAFEELGKFPSTLAETDALGRTALFRLFQPQLETRKGFLVAMAALRQEAGVGSARRLAAAAGAALRRFPVAALACAFPGLWLLAVAAPAMAAGEVSWSGVLSVIFGLTFVVLLAAPGALVWATYRTLRAMKANHFGLCNGMPVLGHDGALALTPQLHALYNGLLGRSPADLPVTFGELWGDKPGVRHIELQMITTSLSLGRPLRLPNDPGVDPLRGFFYDPDEWEALFPAVVMDWLGSHPRAGGSLCVRSESHKQLAALPEPSAWPVVMAVRLSLSFPGLLSAVPMYTIDGARGVSAAKAATGDVEFIGSKVYFSDGGITSNCPISLFDAPLPGRPTFGVNLFASDVDEHGRDPVLWMYGDKSDPESRLQPLAGRGTLATVLNVVMAIVNTAIDWRDTVQRGLPGYRERMIHVGLAPEDGGLNLAMPPSTILRLSYAGARAAERLIDKFALPTRPGGLSGWEVHRWVRLRSTLTATKRHLSRVRDKVASGVPPFAKLPRSSPAPSPAFAETEAVLQADVLIDGMVALMAQVDAIAPTTGLEDNSPQPAPALRMSSPW